MGLVRESGGETKDTDDNPSGRKSDTIIDNANDLESDIRNIRTMGFDFCPVKSRRTLASLLNLSIPQMR